MILFFKACSCFWLPIAQSIAQDSLHDQPSLISLWINDYCAWASILQSRQTLDYRPFSVVIYFSHVFTLAFDKTVSSTTRARGSHKSLIGPTAPVTKLIFKQEISPAGIQWLLLTPWSSVKHTFVSRCGIGWLESVLHVKVASS